MAPSGGSADGAPLLGMEELSAWGDDAQMPYLDAEDRRRRLGEDLERLRQVFGAGKMTSRQYELARARIEDDLAVGADSPQVTELGTEQITDVRTVDAPCAQ